MIGRLTGRDHSSDGDGEEDDALDVDNGCRSVV